MPFNRFDLLSRCDTFSIDSLRDGIQIGLLPNLYQDAIELTRAIGKKYIWIDSLCIIQDSKEDWASECERMSDIYSNCFMTISAMSYQNNELGFRRIRPEDVPPHHSLCPLTGHPGTYVYVRSAIDHKSRTDYLRYRAWAFQELLLSPRILHLTSTAMAFECDTCTELERGPNSDVLYGIDFERKRLVHNASDADDDDRIAYYDRWLQLVQTYSQLELTYKTDRLPALSGIAYLVASKAKDTYIAGLWKQDIAAGLLCSVAFFTKEGDYMSREGRRLGDKKSLVDTLAAVTGVPSTALLGADLSRFSKEARLSWARKRSTKVPEDAAYSLIGIFGVTLPLLYADGNNADRKRAALFELDVVIERAAKKSNRPADLVRNGGVSWEDLGVERAPTG
ncbi:hypothetical protein E8E12_005066 [Didymella heteroderae]|uniref:Heterokaryon incompatibility domain-containing protein n=1 Tax=Didymella heteroderae TaxID=1769908 RepID=A0A9P4WPN9_9PLEO|nr:hypothetical protein E8E12_005066 [Didymella heteroderae]